MAQVFLRRRRRLTLEGARWGQKETQNEHQQDLPVLRGAKALHVIASKTQDYQASGP